MLKQGYSDPELYRYGGDTDKEWYVGFRFTCPVRMKRKPVQVRLGINFFKTARERDIEGKMVKKVVSKALEDGWNPFDCNIETYLNSIKPNEPTPPPAAIILKTPDGIPIATPDTPLAEALDLSYQIKKKYLKRKTKFNYETGLRYAVPAAKALGIDMIPLNRLKRLHVRMILEQIGKDRQESTTRKEKARPGRPMHSTGTNHI
ncbi:hypothetical protein [Chitinophaga sp. XS-30]|uniref:hypothetical protein n=1 Tax=Chitinophaga sp. XS-30 TaxID=2604421 RepID=UPI0011DDFE62|nr:hypothetical protein [Chitinophaga sp. XS-30]QEH40493.1 hypothetical protein FW415_06245 [Chitinophaga sp. XS-30]